MAKIMPLENEIERLNKYQKEAVLEENDACVVNANVGSGKTTVLVAKVHYLHEKKEIPYEKMVVLTFTNKAAAEMKDRLWFGETETVELPFFGTFHSIALKLLKEILPVEELGYTRDFSVIEPDEELELAEQLITDHDLHIKYKNRLKKRLEQEKKAYQDGRTETRYQDDLFQLFSLLLKEKKKQNKVTFDDLLQYANELLERYPFHPSWIIVDEVQDSDKEQLIFLQHLKGTETKLFAVGDPNQVIYSWRGSSENVFYTLKKIFHATELTLPINYRSSSSILEAAKVFLQNGGILEGSREPGHKILIRNPYNPFQEAEYLAGKIKKIHASGIPYKEIAIFYRLQHQSEQLEKVFIKENIPYEVSLKKTIKDIPVLDWFMKVLRFACKQTDLYARDKALGDKVYGPATEWDKQNLLHKMETFTAWAKENTILKADDIYRYLEIDIYLHPTSANYQIEKEQVLSFCNRILEYAREQELDFMIGMSNFLNSSALFGIQILNQEIHETADSVKLMTLHASKGLEFQYVFIIGVNYGLIPLPGKSFEDEDEERRLFFVGITRAKDYLELSYYTNPEQYRAVSGESRYLSMIPEHLTVRADRKKENKTEDKADLQSLRKQVQKQTAAKTVLPEQIPQTERKVQHKRYGLGTIQAEDDVMVTVQFEKYGKKQFIKALGGLEYLD
ncbi:MAG: ATP-dependent helicase [Lachnospiraceae bacterium]|nr:ATP-dependent helicase [Lachnospiraceae bacterium]